MSTPLAAQDASAFALWPAEGKAYLCEHGRFITVEGSQGHIGAIDIGGQNCCIVGALNIATALAKGRTITDMSPLPGGEDISYDYRKALDTLPNVTARRKMDGLIKRWDSGHDKARQHTFARLCAELATP